MRVGKIMALAGTISLSNVGIASAVQPTQRSVSQVFAAWADENSGYKQHRWKQLSIKSRASGFIERFNNDCQQDVETFQLFARLLGADYQAPLANTPVARRAVGKIYSELDGDIGAFIKRMQHAGWRSDKLNKLEEKKRFQSVIDRNLRFAHALCGGQEYEEHGKYMFSLAQTAFFHLFDTGWASCYRMFSDPEQHPVLRFLYSIIWSPLAGSGWKEWSSESLQRLQELAARGKTIRYIAGGCDISELISAGIYNIQIIDPMLPTQPRYYIKDWEWLIGGEGQGRALGDAITFPKGIRLVRSAYDEHPKKKLQVKLADKSSASLPESVTTWEVRNAAHDVLGEVTFERRFCTADDFAPAKKHVLLMSFNELHFIACADAENWGIDPRKLSKNVEVHIKQLHRPVTARMMCNLYKADDSPFSFIRLGSCVK